MALPPPVVVGVLLAEPVKLEGAKTPELLRAPRASQVMVGEAEWKELEVGRADEEEAEERGDGLDGMPRPSEASSLRLPMAMVDTGRSRGSRAGEVVAPPPMRRGMAVGPMEPVELVTEDLRVKLEPVIAMSSEMVEEASSSIGVVAWKEE